MQGLRALSVFAVLLAATATAHADDDLYAGSSTFLDLGSYRTPFKYADGDHAADVGRYGVAFSFQEAGDLKAELHGGYLTLDVAGEPQPTPQSSSGRYLGVQARYEGSGSDYLNFTAEVSYTWMDASSAGLLTDPPAESTWYETWVAAGPLLSYDVWRLSLGAYYQRLDGTETDSTPSRVLDFRAGRSVGGYLGIAVYIQPDYSIGLLGTVGAREGVRLVFRRDF